MFVKNRKTVVDMIFKPPFLPFCSLLGFSPRKSNNHCKQDSILLLESSLPIECSRHSID